MPPRSAQRIPMGTTIEANDSGTYGQHGIHYMSAPKDSPIVNGYGREVTRTKISQPDSIDMTEPRRMTLPRQELHTSLKQHDISDY
jgi:hypothetical protein